MSALSPEEAFAPAEFIALEHTTHAKLFENQRYIWDALKQIASYLQFRLKPAVLGQLMGKPFISNTVFIGRRPPSSNKAPSFKGRPDPRNAMCAAVLRARNVIVGDGVVMGNSCEFKNCILCDERRCPHFNYVGDSI